jgi:hypothetical protein
MSERLKRQMYSIGVKKEDFDKFVKLHESRKQDTTRADTFSYLMNFHREMQEFKPRPQRITHDPNQIHSKIIVAGEDTP